MLPEPTETTTTITAKSRGGAPPLNSNRLKSGARAWAVVSRLPRGCGSVRRALYSMRHEVEAAVVAQHGEISMYHAALVSSALRHEGRAALLSRWLRVEPDLTLAERLAVLRDLTAASDSRDRCLKALGLDAPPVELDPWSTIDNGWQPHGDGLHETSSSAAEKLQNAPGRNGEASHQSEATEPNNAGDATTGSHRGSNHHGT